MFEEHSKFLKVFVRIYLTVSLTEQCRQYKEWNFLVLHEKHPPQCWLELICRELFSFIRFEIEKKLKHAKKLEQKKKKEKGGETSGPKGVVGIVASKRSQERRKDMESKKDNKKLTAMQELKARREEKKNRGTFDLLLSRITCSYILLML